VTVVEVDHEVHHGAETRRAHDAECTGRPP